jgi:DNA-binding NarL/FixJ family response regulator
MITFGIAVNNLNEYKNSIESLKKQNECGLLVSSTDGIHFINECLKLRQIPTILFIEYYIKGIDAITLIEYFHNNHPLTKIVCISSINEDEHVKNTFIAGADGVCNKNDFTPENILKVIEVVRSNNFYLSLKNSLTKDDVMALRLNYLKAKAKYKLTPREKTFSILNATSLTYKEIACLMCIEEKTVEVIGYRLSKKLGIKGGRRNLLQISIKEGLIKLAT